MAYLPKKLRIALMASHRVGELVSSYLAKLQDVEVVALYLDGANAESDNRIAEALPTSTPVYFGKRQLSDPNHISMFKALDIDLLITVYWPWILPTELVESSARSINFHPSLLPINRGWYPHVFSIAHGTPAGVTLHELAESADTGRIWAQREVTSYPFDTARSLYKRLEDEIFSLFISTWRGVCDGSNIGLEQDHSKATYHTKSDVSILDEIDLSKQIFAADLLAILRSRSFGRQGFAYFTFEGKRYYLNLRVSDETTFMDGD